jgi:hypothetical protein
MFTVNLLEFIRAVSLAMAISLAFTPGCRSTHTVRVLACHQALVIAFAAHAYS